MYASSTYLGQFYLREQCFDLSSLFVGRGVSALTTTFISVACKAISSLLKLDQRHLSGVLATASLVLLFLKLLLLQVFVSSHV